MTARSTKGRIKTEPEKIFSKKVRFFEHQTRDERYERFFVYIPPRFIDSVFVRGGIRLKVTPPIHFNDPFEACVSITASDGESFRERYVRQTGRRDFYTSHLEVKQENLRAHLSHAVLQKISAEFGVICASLIPENILMWSHYALSHRGFAIAVDPFGRMAVRQGLCFKRVRYSRKRPTISVTRLEKVLKNPLESNESVFRRCILTKSRTWAYEHEFRAIIPLDSTTREPLDPSKPKGPKGHFIWLNDDSINSVIAGWRMNDEDGEKIARYVSQWRSVSYHRAIPHNDAFALNIRPYYQGPPARLGDPFATNYHPPLTGRDDADF
jgi:hypothetical protein